MPTPPNPQPDPDFVRYKQSLLSFVGDIESVDQGLARTQQSFDDMMQASLDLANIIGPAWKDELRVLIPPLQSLQRRARVLNAAVERFLKDVE